MRRGEQRPLVGHEAEDQVVRGRSPPRTWRSARLVRNSPAELEDHLGPDRIVAAEADEARRGLVRVAGLPMSCRIVAKRIPSRRVRSSASGWRSAASTSAADSPGVGAAGPARSRASAAAPRSCGRRRRGGGWRSGRPHAALRRPAARRRVSSDLVEQLQRPQRVASGHHRRAARPSAARRPARPPARHAVARARSWPAPARGRDSAPIRAARISRSGSSSKELLPRRPGARPARGRRGRRSGRSARRRRAARRSR